MLARSRASGRKAVQHRRRQGRARRACATCIATGPELRAGIHERSPTSSWSAILRGLTPARAPEVGAALVGCGFRTIEVPLNSPDPFDTIKLLAQRAWRDLPGRRRHGAEPGRSR